MEMSTEGFNESVVRRLEELERANRRLTWTTLTLSVILSLMFALGATKPTSTKDTIRARHLEIVDANGNTRISLETYRSGEPQAVMRDDKGNLRIWMSVGPSGPEVWLRGVDGSMRAKLSGAADGASLSLFDETGSQRALFGLQGQQPALSLLDKGGKVIWKAP